jgi:threonine synthase
MVLEPASSVADSIVAGLPRDRIKAMNAVRDTEGAFIAVEDDAIIAAIPRLARRVGVFAEPAASATYAGLLKATEEGMLDADEEIVVIVTGSGLKDVKAAQQSVPTLTPIQPKLDAVLPAIPEELRPD